MRVLLVSPVLPVKNSRYGMGIRSYQILQELATFADVDVITCGLHEIDEGEARDFGRTHRYLGHLSVVAGSTQNAEPLPQRFAKLVDPHAYDYLFCRYYVTADALQLFEFENLVLDCDDCLIEVAQQNLDALRARYVRNLSRPIHVLFSKRSTQIEWKSNFLLLENSVIPIGGAPPQCDASAETRILFIGALDYGPNFHGVDRFLHRIWPRVREMRPNCVLRIAGTGLPERVRNAWQQFDGVQVLGFVNDKEALYRDTHFSICPIYRGSGTHVKVLESLIRARPVVLTKHSHRGYESTLLDGECVFVAGDDQTFFDRIVFLTDHPDICRSMGDMGATKVREHHSCPSVSLKHVLCGN